MFLVLQLRQYWIVGWCCGRVCEAFLFSC